jgi:hypothetical protein
MVIEVPDTTGFTDITSKTAYHMIHPLDHINGFTPQTLLSMMDRAGFEPIHKAPAFVTTSLERVAKDIYNAKFRWPKTTARYFRRREG